MRDRHSRPEALHGVKLGDQMQVILPGPAAVVLEEPQSPPGGGRARRKQSAPTCPPPAAARLAGKPCSSKGKQAAQSDWSQLS